MGVHVACFHLIYSSLIHHIGSKQLYSYTIRVSFCSVGYRLFVFFSLKLSIGICVLGCQ